MSKLLLYRVPTVMENLESHGKVIKNLLKIESYEILLRAEKDFFKSFCNASSSNLANTLW